MFDNNFLDLLHFTQVVLVVVAVINVFAIKHTCD